MQSSNNVNCAISIPIVALSCHLLTKPASSSQPSQETNCAPSLPRNSIPAPSIPSKQRTTTHPSNPPKTHYTSRAHSAPPAQRATYSPKSSSPQQSPSTPAPITKKTTTSYREMAGSEMTSSLLGIALGESNVYAKPWSVPENRTAPIG